MPKVANKESATIKLNGQTITALKNTSDRLKKYGNDLKVPALIKAGEEVAKENAKLMETYIKELQSDAE